MYLTAVSYTHLDVYKRQQLRKDAFKALYGTYGKMKNTIAATYNANVEQACFYADVRNYPSTRAMYLDESNIPEEVYDLSLIHI